MNLFALLDQATQHFSDRGAICHGRDRRSNWSEFRDHALRLAGAIVSENRPAIIELLFAMWAAERVAVPINYKLHPREMAQILDDADVSQVCASQAITG